MKVQFAWTMLTEILVTIAGILLLKFAASLLGPAGFGEYTLSRRAIGLLYLPLVMGLGIAAPRYIAIARAGALDGYSERLFARTTLAAGLLPALAVVLLMNAQSDWSAIVLFGTTSLSRMVPPATVALAGITLHTVVYAIYRGRSEMGFANALQLVNLGVVPVAAFALAPNDAAAVLATTGAAWLVTSGIAFPHLFFREDDSRTGGAGSAATVSPGEHLRLLLRFGLPRVPGEFALVGLFAIPALIAVREHGVIVAGQFSAAMSVLAMASGIFAPVGLVVLPRASAQAATGDIAGLRNMVLRILAGGILVAFLVVLIGELVIPTFIDWYFGAAFTNAIPVFRICLLGTIPYAVYILMRSVLDALDVKAVNSRNLLITLAVLVSLCLYHSGILWMASSLVGSLTLLGALTLRDTYLRLRHVGDRIGSPVSGPAIE